MDVEKITDLIKAINKRKENSDSIAATYRDSNDLKALVALLKNAKIENEEEERDAFDVYNFVAEQYETMGRFSLAAPYRLEALLHAEKLQKKIKAKELQSVAYHLVKDRNHFVDDPCEDVRPLIEKLLGKELADMTYEDVLENPRVLKNDPVEMSEAYLAVIDECEEFVEKNRTFRGMGSCFEMWDLKAQFLAEKGIQWTAPNILNPKFHFD